MTTFNDLAVERIAEIADSDATPTARLREIRRYLNLAPESDEPRTLYLTPTSDPYVFALHYRQPGPPGGFPGWKNHNKVSVDARYTKPEIARIAALAKAVDRYPDKTIIPTDSPLVKPTTTPAEARTVSPVVADPDEDEKRAHQRLIEIRLAKLRSASLNLAPDELRDMLDKLEVYVMKPLGLS